MRIWLSQLQLLDDWLTAAGPRVADCPADPADWTVVTVVRIGCGRDEFLGRWQMPDSASLQGSFNDAFHRCHTPTIIRTSRKMPRLSRSRSAACRRSGESIPEKGAASKAFSRPRSIRGCCSDEEIQHMTSFSSGPSPMCCLAPPGPTRDKGSSVQTHRTGPCLASDPRCTNHLDRSADDWPKAHITAHCSLKKDMSLMQLTASPPPPSASTSLKAASGSPRSPGRRARS